MKSLKGAEDFTLESIISCMPGLVYWKNRDGKYLGCNNALAEVFGLSKSDIIGYDDYHLADKLGWPKSVVESFRSVDLVIMETGIPKFNIEELPMWDKDGNKMLQISNKVPLYDKHGRIIGILGNSIDVTNRKKVEEQLRQTLESAEMNNDISFGSIIACIPGSVYWKNKNGIYLGCNNTLVELLGLPKEEIIGNDDYYFGKKLGWPASVAESLRVTDLQVMEKGKPLLNVEEVPFYDKSGNVIQQITNKVPLYDNNGDIVGVLGNSFDISERKKMEEELRLAKAAAESANTLKTSFIQNMQHDIRTPASGLWAVLDNLVEHQQLPDEELITMLRNSAKQLYIICNEVIDFDRTEYNDFPVLSKRVNLRHMITSIIELNETAAYDRGLKLSSTVDAKIPQVVKGDEYRVSRILINLIGNSLKFTPKGSVSLSAILLKENEKEYIIQFKVQDTGIGIPLDNQTVLYEKFSRLNPANRNIYKGSGLGLHIVKKYVDDIEGDINLESEPNLGTTFFIDIPFGKSLGDAIYGEHPSYANVNKIVEKENTMNRLKSTAKKPPSDSKVENSVCNVLLIEDNQIALTIAKTILNNMHCQVTTTVDVKSSLEALNKSKFDLVVSDIGLPDGTGIDIINQIKKDKKSLNASTPFIAITANADKDTIETSEQAGFIHVYAKPLEAKIIQPLVDKISAGEKVEPVSMSRKSSNKLVGLDLPSTEKELFKLSDYPLFDFEEGIKTLGNEETLLDILNMLLSSLPNDKQEIKEIYDSTRDWKRIEELAHKAKGGVSYCGTLKLKYACQYLERYHKAGYAKLLEQLYQQLMEVWDETQKCLEDYLKQKSS